MNFHNPLQPALFFQVFIFTFRLKIIISTFSLEKIVQIIHEDCSTASALEITHTKVGMIRRSSLAQCACGSGRRMTCRILPACFT